MTIHSARSLRSIRVFFITIAVGFAGSFRSMSRRPSLRRGLISAVLLLAVGGGQAVACEDEQVSIEDLLKDSGYVVGNYEPAAETAREPLTQDEVLAGSGYETATTEVAGSGQIDETERALALHELATTPSSPYINGRGQLAYELTEHATAVNAQASQAELVDESERALALIALTSDTGFVAQTQNQRSITLIESTFAVGGVLAGGEQPVTINGRGQVTFTETEHALAQHAISAVDLAPQSTSPNTPY